ncbi:MAG TPA: uroporphyrinogen-III synthase [Candidatus Limnocylindrales bacterium]|nr:uroporphyrinogen-III synthase [Candidatus Limnocylindrales bacterium]
MRDKSSPLLGKRILVTRAQEQAGMLVKLLEEQGAKPLEFPVIEIVPPASWEKLDQAISRLEDYTWLIFTSVNGVKYFLQRLTFNGKDLRNLKDIRICTIGPGTAAALEKLGIQVHWIPDEYRAEAIVAGLGKELIGRRVLLPRAEIARDLLPEQLKKLGVEIEVVTAYRTIQAPYSADQIRALLQAQEVDMITFTSSSTVRNFLNLFEEGERIGLLGRTLLACIGPITAETVRKFGLSPHIVASEYTIPGLVRAIVEFYRSV